MSILKSRRTRVVLQSLLLFVVTLVVVVVVGQALFDSAVDEATGPQGSEPVAEVWARPAGERMALRGFVFDGEPWGLRLCERRHDGDPPRCEGTFIGLERLDPVRLQWQSVSDDAGATLRWVEDSVTLLGTRQADEFVVEEIVQ